MTEDRQTKIKRLHMRSMRRGIKEMDLILSSYATAHLDQLSDDDLNVYDALLAENDHDIYGWITKQATHPAQYDGIMTVILDMAEGIARPA